ncbi:hypothetical protein KQX54_010990 [Cotesia glomerata]|uniref:Uncharacterized protein n=1 Tax=Cotesia glomerata TaxID=32391 RepID=A0AAV7I1Z9_COTGL|nr:hypothetical protein KQX54_010990 [Cotesia glomerata]
MIGDRRLSEDVAVSRNSSSSLFLIGNRIFFERLSQSERLEGPLSPFGLPSPVRNSVVLSLPTLGCVGRFWTLEWRSRGACYQAHGLLSVARTCANV